MTKQILRVVVVLALLAFPASAEAGALILEPPEGPFVYQQWADEAKVPTADLTITVGHDLSRCESFDIGCTDAANWIEIGPGSGAEAEDTFDHELGHAWVQHDMVPWQRDRFRNLIHHPGLPWSAAELEAVEGQPMNPWRTRIDAEEWFADAYSLCARLGEPTEMKEVVNGIMSRSALDATCRMIRRG
jgi:hypothetical protein